MRIPLNFIRNVTSLVQHGSSFDLARDDYYCNIFTRDSVGADVALVPQEEKIYKSNYLPRGRATMEAPDEPLWKVSPSRKTICLAADEEMCMAMYQSPRPSGFHVLAVHLEPLSQIKGEFEVTPSGVGSGKAKIYYRDGETSCGAFPCALTTNFEGGWPQLLITSEDRTFKIKNVVPVDSSEQQQ